VNEARNSGGTICLPCVNRSAYTTSIDGKNIYLGFDCLLNLEGKLARLISEERQQNGSYRSLENFVLRTGAGLEQLIVLIRCGAFQFTGVGKKELLWEAHILMSGKKQKTGAVTLFENLSAKPVLPKLESSVLEDIYDEIELIGFPISASMFDLAKSSFRGELMAKDLCSHEGKTVRMVGDFIAEKTTRTKNGTYMKFATFLDVEGCFFDTVHFPPSLKTYPLRGNGLYLIQGKVMLDFGCPSLEVQKCARMPLLGDPRSE
jgi:DNA polymerase-3 subunit alpha